jgi:TPR repeat protein
MPRNSWAFLIAVLVALALGASARGAENTGDFYNGQDAYRAYDYDKAFGIWKPLAERGNLRAQYWLAQLYFFGQGTEKNDVLAAKWYETAAKRGHLIAMFKLASLYARGDGVPYSERRVVYWYTQAANRGHLQSALTLAGYYTRGAYVTQHEGKARFWYRRAAMMGSSVGVMKLAQNLMSSKRIPRDYRRAYTWLLIAEAKRLLNARKYRLALTKHFHGDEIIRARKWAKDFLTKGKLPPRLKGEW